MKRLFFKLLLLALHKICFSAIGISIISVVVSFGQTSPATYDLPQERPGISMEEGRKIWKGIFDIPRLIHTRAVIQIARDQQLVDRCEAFMLNNQIKVLNIGYIESEEFWPSKGMRNQENWLAQESVAAQLTGRIIFIPVLEDEKVLGYKVELSLEGKSIEVYHIMLVSDEDLTAIVEESETAYLGGQVVEHPNEAREKVVSAMIASLDRIESTSLAAKREEEKNEMVAKLLAAGPAIYYDDIRYQPGELARLKPDARQVQLELASAAEITGFPEDKITWLPLPAARQGLSATFDISGYKEAEPMIFHAMVGTKQWPFVSAKDPKGSGLIYNPVMASINELSEELILEKERARLVYTLKNGGQFPYSKIDIFKIGEEDPVLLASYTDPVGGNKVTFKDADGQGGWAGKTLQDSLVSPGDYLVKVSLAMDEAYQHGYTDYEVVKVKSSVLVSATEMLATAQTATTIGTKYKGNETDPACNICVRSALYLLKGDTVLFPTSGSGFNDPENDYKIKDLFGHISPDGRAYFMKGDFDKLSSKPELNNRFVEVAKTADEEWEAYFGRLQGLADAGHIVMGTMLNRAGTSGHVMVITPGGLVEIDVDSPKWGESFARKSRNILNVPRVLECGTGARSNESPLCLNVDYNGAINRLKWYEYKF